MSMTKKEKAEMQALRVLAALRWSDPVAPDVMPPEEGFVIGWRASSYSGHVEKAWTESGRHGHGHTPQPPGHGSQRGVHLYSTKLLALRATRYEMARRFANELAAIDAKIADELAWEPA